ncbi:MULTISPECIES: 4-hydroxy-3-methylbut-2-enyl diphosphate reductase [Bartonella]|uniref:4-hydroxy-3-methylbut-2-enyl diphosphate reductase n=1 Tax=Bartonella choladocola TaxID=2750995 RepID=A0A1U9MGJ0_9HYPH|nr:MULTISPECIES: 4-hydroxy-3-methylbut-2-enyl diphosphate reductase [Bartonella]AQT46848.1 4-hydroxy-3-methylbut-2-enyl diphosphate reductase [Bartonella choladocola]MBH9974144.1 4-hydroxy-3-methylbut-2-enyl diphosphate reductase [Bartonella choladocola]MBI0013751.1 4-hydroxy-3-methylbut-2-enyl diphosphate reductase [Bartonella sp. B10834G3]MBI0140203.1 4-hydroxy-3-methylbut-2-enyl diphosphate reductase [Bartonella choladocola]
MTSKPPLTIRLCGPRGFCAGVDRAIQIVILALKKYGAPVYVRHEIVHNRYVVEGLQARGAIFVEELDEIPAEHHNQPVIFSAHGVPKSVPETARLQNLFYLDATCPLVSKVHKQAMRHQRNGRHVILIGHSGHPEVIGTMGQVEPDTVTLIENVEDAEKYQPLPGQKLGFVSQTTLSVEDTAEIIAVLKRRFPDIEPPAAESICYATTNRQEAVRAAAPGSDLFLIVGAPNSSNSRRLVEVAERFGAKQSLLVQRASEIDFAHLDNIRTVSLSAGASAPEIIVDEIIAAFRKRFDVTIEIAETAVENETFLVNRELREVVLTPEDMEFVNGKGIPDKDK